ncbi:hypothetical protein OHA21_43765 [Actinoplanes sp. NBC_00393]|uniref:hypothetical protein n=1 Tax=Actinoplanes sp. NBC_00393 TaxID=2975953 RepID=UPI002E23ED76
MTDLRDQLPAFEAAARRLLGHRPKPTRTRASRPATCHPSSAHYARGLCRRCYDHHHDHGTLTSHATTRWRLRTAEFAAEYALLRSDGHTRTAIAARLGVTRNAVDQAYRRAVRAGLLTPDRRAA